MKAFLTICGHEWMEAVASPLGWRITIGHLILATLAFLIGWPAAYTLGEAAWAPALVIWVYAEILMLSYLAIAIPADTMCPPDAIRPGQWILYGDTAPLTVIAGQSAATVGAVLFWLLTASPLLLLGLAVRPLSATQLFSLGGFVLLLVWALSQVGAWISVAFDSRSYRMLAVDIAYLFVMLGTLVVHSIATAQSTSPSMNSYLLIQPIDVASSIINVTPQSMLAATAPGQASRLFAGGVQTEPVASIVWSQLIFVYGGLALVAYLLALATLRQWQAHYAGNKKR